MRILLINHYAGSIQHGMEYRPYYLAREWVRMGHQVTIVASSISHVRTKQPAVSGSLTKEEIDGICYVWLKTPPYKGNGGKRVINIFSFITKLFASSRQIIRGNKPDIVIASSTYPMDIWPATKMARSSHAHLVFEVHDLWPLSPIELGGMSQHHPFIQLVQSAENFAYRNADHVVSLLPKAEEYMRAHGLKTGKFLYIPNGVDVSEWFDTGKPLPGEHLQTIESLRRTGRFLVGYAGTHGLANALYTLIESATLMQDLPVALILVGQGPEKEYLQKKARELGLGNVHFLSAVPKTTIPSLLASFDALYIGWKKESLYRFGISPNKLLDYMMAAKPVIQAIQAGNDLVKESGCGISISPENPAAIRDAVKEMIKASPEMLKDMGQKGRAFVLTHHDYRVLAKQFLAGIGLCERPICG